MKRMDPRIVLFIGVMITSFSPVVVKNASAPSLVLTVWRLGWTMLIMIPIAFRRRESFKTVSRRDMLTSFAAGILFALHLICWFSAVKHSSVATASVLCCTEVIFAAIGYALFLKGKIPTLGVVAIVVSFAGSLMLALSKSGGEDTLYGNIIGLLCGFFIGCYTLIGRVERGRLSTTVYTTLTYTSCFLTLLTIALVTRTPLFSYDLPNLAFSSLYLTITCTFLGHTIFTWSLKWLSPSYVASMKLCAPGGSAVFAFLLLSEGLGLFQVVGCAVTLLGAFLYTRAEEHALKAARQAEELSQADV